MTVSTWKKSQARRAVGLGSRNSDHEGLEVVVPGADGDDGARGGRGRRDGHAELAALAHDA